MGKWITYKIPSELSEQIDEFIENQGKKILYPTKAQFMAAAIRNHLYRERSSESVRISKHIGRDLDEWIKTKEAKQLGYSSKDDFVDKAVQELFSKVRLSRFTNITIFEKENEVRLVDNNIALTEDPRIILKMKSLEKWFCTKCENEDCEHVQGAKSSDVGRSFIEFVENYDPEDDYDYLMGR